jgi:hypothetical protein
VHPRNGARVVGKGAAPVSGMRRRCTVPTVHGFWHYVLTVRAFAGTVPLLFALPPMARHTQATLTARVGMASRALGLPLHHHAGADGFAVGALRLIRVDGFWSLFQVVNNAGAGDLLIRGDGGDVVAFLAGMVAAANVARVGRRVVLPGETL